MMLSFSPLLFIPLLLANKAWAFPPFPPVGTTGDGGGECENPTIVTEDCTNPGQVVYTLNRPCPDGKKAENAKGIVNFCRRTIVTLTGTTAEVSDVFFSYKGTCTDIVGGSQVTVAAADFPAALLPNCGTIPSGTTPLTTTLTTIITCVNGFACENSPAPYNRRNLLAGDALKGEDSFAGTEDDVLEFFEKCGKYEYEGLLHVTDHLYALGIPSEEAKEANCPYVMINSLVGNREDPMSTEARKEIKFWSNKEDFEEAFPSTGSLSFGFFLGAKVSEAFHKADVTTPGFLHYDAIKNNCGTFMINLANELDVKIDGKVTSFVARRLMEKAGEDLVNQFRNSVHFPSLFDGHNRQLRGDVIDGKQLVELVVESTAADLLN